MENINPINKIGYIYVRNHDSYKEDNACKLGKAKNIVSRDGGYIIFWYRINF